MVSSRLPRPPRLHPARRVMLRDTVLLLSRDRVLLRGRHRILHAGHDVLWRVLLLQGGLDLFGRTMRAVHYHHGYIQDVNDNNQ
jgi:hypothetical protein